MKGIQHLSLIRSLLYIRADEDTSQALPLATMKGTSSTETGEASTSIRFSFGFESESDTLQTMLLHRKRHHTCRTWPKNIINTIFLKKYIYIYIYIKSNPTIPVQEWWRRIWRRRRSRWWTCGRPCRRDERYHRVPLRPWWPRALRQPCRLRGDDVSPQIPSPLPIEEDTNGIPFFFYLVNSLPSFWFDLSIAFMLYVFGLIDFRSI